MIGTRWSVPVRRSSDSQDHMPWMMRHGMIIRHCQATENTWLSTACDSTTELKAAKYSGWVFKHIFNAIEDNLSNDLIDSLFGVDRCGSGSCEVELRLRGEAGAKLYMELWITATDRFQYWTG